MSPSRGWDLVSIDELATGGVFSDGDWVESKDQDPIGDVRLTQLADVGVATFRNRSDRWMRVDQAERLRCTYLHPGDVLIARMPEPIGRACLVPESIGQAVTAVDVAVLRIKRPDVDQRYVMWALNAPSTHEAMIAVQSGTTRKRIARRKLGHIAIPLPPISEQRQIVDILEEHFSRLDAADQLLQRSKARLEALEQQFFVRALIGSSIKSAAGSGQLTDVGLDDGFLADLPSGWRWKRLGDVAEVVGGVTKDASKQSDPSFVEVPYLRVANVQRGWLDLTKVTTIRVPESKANSLTLRRGDVLLNEGGDRDKLGRGWVWNDEIPNCIHQNHVFRARLRDGVLDPHLLSWAANTLGGPWCQRNGKQSVNLASISMSRIRLMPIPVPPVDIQPELVRTVTEQLKANDRLRAALKSSEHRSTALRRALLRAAFAGHLSGNLSDLERAEESINA